MKYKITTNQLITKSIHHIKAEPIDQKLNFTAGQYIEFIVSEKELAPFSVANAPNDAGILEFYIRYDTNDPLLQKLFSKLEAESEICVLGPFGDCVYQPSKQSSVILLAGGVGISQIKSILEQAIIENDQRHFHLYWALSKQEDYFLEKTLQQFQQKLSFFNYTTVLRSVEAPELAIVRDFNDLSECLLYSSGPWSMTDQAVALFKKHHLPSDAMRSDRFAFM